ncbi:signal transduction histidine kinase [Polaromonas sp. CF318]|uniref:CHASE3 domain-containing protein n=1 Tax=Polaromonas sp. CF318 TaxID=1144318 RepID=UPI0002711829|nr:CHASE3 domain-containing protein [Polaromonas sp. CF318]EJL80436.1 signal transduction histidine kinase [Polaromonas sp. CF318]
MRSTSRKMAVNVACALIAVLTLIGISELSYDKSMDAMDEVAQAHLTRSHVQRLLRDVLDAETGQRGYLLTGDTMYLEPYKAAIADIGQTQDQLRELLAARQEQAGTLSLLGRTVQRKLAEMDLSIRMKNEGKDEAWRFVLTTEVGKEQMDAIRNSAGQLIEETNQDTARGYAEVRRSLLLTRIGITLVASVAFVAFWLYLRQTAALDQAGQRQQLALQAERDLLNVQVKERTSRLAELATHLQQVREQERDHLARELHDELGALLTAAKLDITRIKARLSGENGDLPARIEHLIETLNSGIALKRRIIEDLRPSSLSNLGLLPALEILTREFAQRSGLSIVTNLEPAELDETIQLTVYRLAQEALTNIARYAQAQNVEINLLSYKDYIIVTVHDDGRGFDPQAVQASSHGLQGMRHRVEASGGHLDIDTSQGTTISATLPLVVRRAAAAHVTSGAKEGPPQPRV